MDSLCRICGERPVETHGACEQCYIEECEASEDDPEASLYHHCHVCHERMSTPPDGRCRKCRSEGREFLSFSDIPQRLAEIEAELKKTESEILREYGT